MADDDTQLDTILKGAVAELAADGTVTLVWLDPPPVNDPNAVAWPQRRITVVLGQATIVQLNTDPDDELEALG